MRSERSFFKGSVFWKDITRFCPVWGLFTLGLGLLLLCDRTDACRYMAWFLPAYAFLCVALLFGDLYRRDLCDALHSMPLRRESWFFTHGSAGFLFFAVPFGLFFPFSGQLFLEFLFFYGMALLCCMCAGNHPGAGILFLLANVLTSVAQWYVSTLYRLFFYGFPVLKVSAMPLLQFPEMALQNTAASWLYFGICGILGLLMAWAALLLYRKRKLESAGDPISVPWLRPVAVYLLALSVAAGLFVLLDHKLSRFPLVILYFLLGYFAGRMLLLRQRRSFHKHTLWGGIIPALLLLALYLLSIPDLTGQVGRVPEASQVTSAQVCLSTYPDNREDPGNRLRDPALLQLLTQLHRDHLQTHNEPREGEDMLCITYELADGSRLQRQYPVEWSRELTVLLSSCEALFGMDYESFCREFRSLTVTLPEKNVSIHVDSSLTEIGMEHGILVSSEALEARLLSAIRLDMENGDLLQRTGDSEYILTLELSSGTKKLEYHDNTNIQKFLDIVYSYYPKHCWLRDDNIDLTDFPEY